MLGAVIKIKLLLSLLVLAVLISGGCKETRVTYEQVLATIDSVENELNWLDYRMNLEQWQVINGQPSDSIIFFQELHQAYFRDPAKLALLRPNRALIKANEIAVRKYDLILNRLLKGHVESSSTISSLRDSILAWRVTNSPQLGSKNISNSQIEQILAFSSDKTEREEAFRAKSTTSESVAQAMGQLIRLRNQEASRLGYNDYFAMTFPTDGITLSQYRKLLDSLEAATSVPYQNILDRIGNNDQLEPWDIIYNLIGSLRELYNRPVIESQWLLTFDLFQELGFDLNKLPIYTQLSVIAENPATVTSLAINPPYDQRIISNMGAGIKHTKSLVSSLARLIHTNSISESSPLFVNRMDGAWSQGMADLFGDMVTDSIWLTSRLTLPAPAIASVLVAQKDIELVRVRLLLLQANFEYEAYRSRKPDLNQLYWDLCDRIMRLARHDDLNLWASDINLAAKPIESQNPILGKIIAIQTKAYLERVNGTVVGNPETRSFLLQNYMRFGARYPWSELLKRGTGEELDYKYLVQALVN